MKNKKKNQKIELNLLALGSMLKKSYGIWCLGRKKSLNLVKILKKKIEKFWESYLKLYDKKVFLFLGNIEPKTRKKFELSAIFSIFISIVSFGWVATLVLGGLGFKFNS